MRNSQPQRSVPGEIRGFGRPGDDISQDYLVNVIRLDVRPAQSFVTGHLY
jgi:hypothetical protein